MKMFERDHGYRAIGTRFGQSVFLSHGSHGSWRRVIPKRIPSERNTRRVFTTQNIISKPTNRLSVQIIKWNLQGIQNLEFPKRRFSTFRNL